MNRRRILFVIGSIIVVISLIIGLVYIFSHQQVRYRYGTPISSVKLYYLEKGHTDAVGLASQKTVTPVVIENDKEVSVRKGEYILEVTGNNIEEQNTLVTVGDKKIDETLDYTYSVAYLRTLYTQQRDAILGAITQKYPLIPSLYTYDTEQLLKKGDWAVIVMSYIGTDYAQRDTIRFILKNEGRWQIAAGPRLVFSYAQYGDIPHDIIDAANIDAYLPDGETPTIHNEFTSDEHEEYPVSD